MEREVIFLFDRLEKWRLKAAKKLDQVHTATALGCQARLSSAKVPTTE